MCEWSRYLRCLSEVRGLCRCRIVWHGFCIARTLHAIIFSLEILMRGYKLISWKQYQNLCGWPWKVHKNSGVVCAHKGRMVRCCAKNCLLWRKLSRADTMAEKITVRAKRPVQQPQPETPPCKHEWVRGFNQRTGERGMVCRKCQKGRRIRRVR